MKSFGLRFWKLLVDIYWRIRSSELLPGKSISLSRTEKLAQLLLDKGALKVQLFGSIARRGDGNDLDIIAIVPDYISDEFENEVKVWAIVKTPRKKSICAYSLAQERQWITERLLEISQEEISLIVTGKPRKDVYLTQDVRQTDIFLLPDDWQENWNIIDIPRKDPCFFTNIAKDVREFDPVRGEFHGFSFWQINFGKLPWRWWKLCVDTRLRVHKWRDLRKYYCYAKFRRRRPIDF